MSLDLQRCELGLHQGWFVFAISPVAALAVLASQPTQSLSQLHRSIPSKLLHGFYFTLKVGQEF